MDHLDADEDVLLDFYQQVGDADMLVPLAEHHTANGVHSYFVLFDRTATFDHPGTAAYRAVHLRRDLEQRTFAFEQAVLPLPALAQSWLIHRGCRPDAITLNPDLGPLRPTRRPGRWSGAWPATATTTRWATPTPATIPRTWSPSSCCGPGRARAQPHSRGGRRGRQHRMDLHAARGPVLLCR
ncbi:hypothetical protein ACQPXT_34710 [Streptomyces sp. CA-100214]